MKPFFGCPECGRAAKCFGTIPRLAEDDSYWKYRRYECASGHRFSTAEQVYEPVQGRKLKLSEERLPDDDTEENE